MKQKLIHWLTLKLLPVIESKELIVFNGKQIFIDGKPLNDAEIRSLKAEAQAMNEFRLWKLIVNYHENLAMKKMFKEAQDMNSLLFGKSVLYALSIQKEIIEKTLKC